MVEMKTKDLPLPALFEQARQIHSEATDSTVDQNTLKRACDLLHQCEVMIDWLGLFSPNEGKEDISTTDLKYLLVPYYLGELTEKIQNSNRLQIVRTSQLHLKEFVSICEKLELVPKEELEALVQDGTDSPEARRAKKVARFKRQKAADSKLQDIKERKERRSRSMQAAAIATSIEHGEESIPDDDSEEEREAWLTTISLALCKVLDLLDGLKKEEELVSCMMETNLQIGQNEVMRTMLEERSKKVEAWHKDAARRSRFEKPMQPITCATFATDVLEGRANPSQVNEHKHKPLLFGPASVVSGNRTTEREQIAAQVFQPRHRMPTMSIEEAGMREMEIMNKWQEQNAKQLKEANSSWFRDGQKDATSDDDEAAGDKARAWDDWKDDNPRGGKLGIQDVCWVRCKGNINISWVLMAIHGPSLLAIWNTNTGRCIWKYDAAPHILVSLRRDPFDFRHVCVLGFKGLLLYIKVTGDGENEIVLKEHQLQVSEIGNLKSDKEGGSNQSSVSPALALFPNVFIKCLFSSKWTHILYVMLPREIIIFDLQYGMSLSVTGLPRGSAQFFDLITDVHGDLLYCAHVDGKISMWKRKKGKQALTLCMLEALMPLMGTSVPLPTILAVCYCSSELEIEIAGRMDLEEESGVNPFEQPHYTEKTASSMLSKQPTVVLETSLISVSDDGKVWKWLLTAEVPREVHIQEMNHTISGDSIQQNVRDILVDLLETEVDGHSEEEDTISHQLHTSIFRRDEPIFQLKLIGQLHLLSSTITTLAVPAPSLTATLAGGGNGPAISVPLVALATQGGCIEVVDVAATAVATSFSIHHSAIRGLRWLGNSKLVSFSYTQGNEKAGGYINRLAVTCVRSGISRFFRVLQKPERAPMRALRASPSGRYLLILFREAPVEVWAMTRNPQMLRSLALPFTVLEWALPPVPKPQQKAYPRQASFFSKERPTVAAASAHSSDSKSGMSESATEEVGETFAFALVNGSVGVFEVRGRRVRDFRPKWPSSSFVSPDVLVTAMAYRLPHVVMGDRLGNIRWWDVLSGLSSSFNTHRGGIRRIKFAPVVLGDQSRGRVAVLFNDNTFSIYDLDTQDPLANAILQSQFAGILLLELEWFPLRFDKKEPLLLCLAGADGSFRLLEVNTNLKKSVQVHEGKAVKEKFHPMPLCSPALLPPPHALALRMLLQWGVHPSWFEAHKSANGMDTIHNSGMPSMIEQRDLRHYMLDTSLPVIGDLVVPELLLKIVEPYRKAGRLLDNDRVQTYAALLDKGCTRRFAFAAAHFGEFSEALFWLQLPYVLSCLTEKILEKSFPHTKRIKADDEPSTSDALHIMKSEKYLASLRERKDESLVSPALSLQDCSFHSTPWLPYRGSDVMPSGQGALCANALERISWHAKLGGEDASQKRVHELVAVGDLEAAVTLLLSTPPDSPYFYVDALRAVALSSAVSSALHELTVKVVAANMVGTDMSLSGAHLLCAVGCYQEACSQLQDAGCWTDAATLAASHLQGSDYARVLQRWADHILDNEHNIWRALILYVTAGALHKALAVLRDSQEPDTAAMFLLACHETKVKFLSKSSQAGSVVAPNLHNQGQVDAKFLDLPGDLNQQQEDVLAVCEYYGHYQRTLVHLCTDLRPILD